MASKAHSTNNGGEGHQNNLFLDELVQDFDISLSGFGCENTNVSLIRDLNQVINTLGDNIKVEAVDNEEAQDPHESPTHLKYFRTLPESPLSNENSCGSYTSTDSEKKVGKSFADLSDQFGPNKPERKTNKRLCFQQFSADELSPLNSVSSSMESTLRYNSDNSHSNPGTPTTPTFQTPNPKNQENAYGYTWRRYSRTDAPSVHNKVSSVQVGRSIKAEAEPRVFQYILGAPTASGVKLGSLTMTYLNQAQPYELRLKKIADIPNYDGKNLRTTVRLGFVEKRLQYREMEEVSNWCRLHSKDRILDVDFALSYGIFDVQINSTKTNCLEFVWNPNREASIFIKLNCISTEFTSKRHGGERGTPLRLILETHGTQGRIDAAQCLVKVFKSKGADRKHKTDRERIAKQPDSSLYYQPSYDCTLLTYFSEDEILVRSVSPTDGESCPSPNISSTHTPSESPHPSVQLPTSSTTCYQSKSNNTSVDEPVYSPITAANSPLPSEATNNETYEWLIKNRFHRLTEILMNFSSDDLRRLNREDLIQICGVSDGIRLFNTIHAIQGVTRLTVFVTSDGKVHNAIYLRNLTQEEFKEKLVEALGITSIPIKNYYLIGPNDIRIKVTDHVVMNMKNESIYSCNLDKEEDVYNLLIQSNV